MKKITIVAFGNSITESAQMSDENKRWTNILKSKLTETFKQYDFNVINSGIGGNSARDAMNRYEKDVLSYDPDYVLLEFGGNNDDFRNPARIVSEDGFRQCLARFKSGLPAKANAVVITFPPIIDEQHCFSKLPGYLRFKKEYGTLDSRVEVFRQITRTFARENNFPIADLSAEIRSRPPALHTLPDGVHLTEQGNELLADMVFKILEQVTLQC